MKAHPKEMYFLSLIEMCQRFAFWGIGNLLVLYVVSYYQFSDKDATQLYGIFSGIAFILPVLGGYIADRTDYKKAVILGLLLTAAGCLLLASGSLSLLYVGLLCAALGAGVFTPSIYTILGHLYQDHSDTREGGFSIYYSSVNIGVFLATFILGALGHTNHWGLAFILAAAIQVLGLLLFLKVIRRSAFSQLHLLKKDRFAQDNAKALTRLEKGRIAVICILSFVSILFWMSYMQGWSSMSLFALRYTEKTIGGFNIPASWLLSLESLYLIILAFPLAWLYKNLARREMDPSPAMKTALSLISMGACFFIMQRGAYQISEGAQSGAISPNYLIFAFAFMAIAEMLIAPIGLSLVTRLSPRRYTALFVGVWYVCIGIAFYLGGWIAGWMSSMKVLSSFFDIFVYLSWIPAVLLLFAAKKLTKLSHTKSL